MEDDVRIEIYQLLPCGERFRESRGRREGEEGREKGERALGIFGRGEERERFLFVSRSEGVVGRGGGAGLARGLTVERRWRAETWVVDDLDKRRRKRDNDVEGKEQTGRDPRICTVGWPGAAAQLFDPLTQFLPLRIAMGTFRNLAQPSSETKTNFPSLRPSATLSEAACDWCRTTRPSAVLNLLIKRS